MRVEIYGSGVAGMCVAACICKSNLNVIVRSKSNGCDKTCCSWWAGGMLAPNCEAIDAPPKVIDLSAFAKSFWKSVGANVELKGSLVVPAKGNQAELKYFQKRTNGSQHVTSEQIKELEPEIDNIFEEGLYFPNEAHIEPRQALKALYEYLLKQGVIFEPGIWIDNNQLKHHEAGVIKVDCRGYGARDSLADLRGVKGEMLVIKTNSKILNRPLRLLHPRFPCYLVPRSNNSIMIGATMIETEDTSGVTLRSALELGAAAMETITELGESIIVEFGHDLRPAFSDNCPKISYKNGVISVNGLYRHGFLVAPGLAMQVKKLLQKLLGDNISI